MLTRILLQPGFVAALPSSQAAIDLIPEWISNLPDKLGVIAGHAPLFDDPRAAWALEKLGGVQGGRVLELGPMEGGHTYMLLRAGAADVVAIEANKQAYLKCLIAKELLKLSGAQFLLGDFVPWLAQTNLYFDVVWATGVLDQVINPLGLLACIALRTDKIHVFTHYIPDDGLVDTNLASSIIAVEQRPHRGRMIPHFMRALPDSSTTSHYSGGLYTASAWLRRIDILDELKLLGFSQIEIGFESATDNGPCFAFVAKRCASGNRPT
ncbi:hypothetical protein SAMN02745126_05803 [Enhydrobacter aerosaccus]|uniref:Methyltransferase domain-containing protein n=1 Tax=Enhydrobacter aerosaccus TaxID=225324 RepID=A0A1T4T7H9_9HYPH|nr:class I SAM-dependent methyltransferase [Enhydrobacter aerosaccus]SKA36299.1 hypothetical protein SAMN02745126_05803 [Enhydrobacter aerosaccus]